MRLSFSKPTISTVDMGEGLWKRLVLSSSRITHAAHYLAVNVRDDEDKV